MRNRVLIVDDELLVANALARALKALGCDVNAHTQPSAALESLATFAPSLVLSDLHMPDMRGTLFLAEVKRRFPAVQRVLVSAFLDDVSPEELADIEPCELVPKPWSQAILKALLVATEQVGS